VVDSLVEKRPYLSTQLSVSYTKPFSLENHSRTWKITPTMPLLLSYLWDLCKMQNKILTTNTTTTPHTPAPELVEVFLFYFISLTTVIGTLHQKKKKNCVTKWCPDVLKW